MTKSERKINDEDIIRGITEFEANYLSLDKDRLVLFTVNFLESRKIEPTFDKIVVTAFKLFPKKFSLIGFPEYPDGRTIYYCAYNHCTLTKRWLSGNVQSAFKVTERGRYFLDETKKMLEGKIKSTRLHESIPRRKEATFINALKKTDAYKKYTDGRKEEITKSEIYETLKAPQYSNELVQAHLERYFDYADRIQDSNAIEFLNFIRRKLKGEEDA
jgi:hypothetical protein